DVIVGDPEGIDAAEAGGHSGLGDALGIAIIAAGEAGVHQQGFAGGADDEGGGSSFYVDPIDVEGAFAGGLFALTLLSEGEGGESEAESYKAHHEATLSH